MGTAEDCKAQGRLSLRASWEGAAVTLEESLRQPRVSFPGADRCPQGQHSEGSRARKAKVDARSSLKSPRTVGSPRFPMTRSSHRVRLVTLCTGMSFTKWDSPSGHGIL